MEIKNIYKKKNSSIKIFYNPLKAFIPKTDKTFPSTFE